MDNRTNSRGCPVMATHTGEATTSRRHHVSLVGAEVLVGAEGLEPSLGAF